MLESTCSRRQFLKVAGGLAAIAGVGLVGCKGQSSNGSSATAGSGGDGALSGQVTAVGSSALQPLAEAAAERFMKVNPGVQITVQGGGSGTGLTQIAQGACQIGDSDVFAEEKGIDTARLVDNRVCVVGMGPVANPKVGVEDLTMDQLKRIFTGSITNWSEVGGADQQITLINRASGSGTRSVFEAAVLNGAEAASGSQEQDSSGTVASLVATTPGAISYLAFSYYDDSMLALKLDGVEPAAERVEQNEWPIWAYEHMYTASDADAATKAFVDYVLDEEIQRDLVAEKGYIPISGMKVERDADGHVSER